MRDVARAVTNNIILKDRKIIKIRERENKWQNKDIGR